LYCWCSWLEFRLNGRQCQTSQSQSNKWISWKKNETIFKMDWPARYSTLNPIEHVWYILHISARFVKPTTIQDP
jgi:hypothetical protein